MLLAPYVNQIDQDFKSLKSSLDNSINDLEKKGIGEFYLYGDKNYYLVYFNEKPSFYFNEINFYSEDYHNTLCLCNYQEEKFLKEEKVICNVCSKVKNQLNLDKKVFSSGNKVVLRYNDE